MLRHSFLFILVLWYIESIFGTAEAIFWLSVYCNDTISTLALFQRQYFYFYKGSISDIVFKDSCSGSFRVLLRKVLFQLQYFTSELSYISIANYIIRQHRYIFCCKTMKKEKLSNNFVSLPYCSITFLTTQAESAILVSDWNTSIHPANDQLFIHQWVKSELCYFR